METVILFNHLVILYIVSYKYICYMLYSNRLRVMTKVEWKDDTAIMSEEVATFQAKGEY